MKPRPPHPHLTGSRTTTGHRRPPCPSEDGRLVAVKQLKQSPEHLGGRNGRRMEGNGACAPVLDGWNGAGVWAARFGEDPTKYW